MALVAGRSNHSRTQTIGTTLASTAITGAAGTFREEDAGRSITGAGIPAGATLASTSSETAGVLSAAATLTGVSVVATFGGDAANTYGFSGWSPETDAESETYTVVAKGGGAVSPEQLTNATSPITQRERA